ncbi:IS3 family transposase [Belnapia moabensis]|uniref:IS3 family transposase n=1 Tax=Belnapia moabensis TaxID=365533 RepID=UPI000693AF43|nr:IS3 family transposase [Belnapia moabensis]
MSYAFIHDHVADFPIQVICEVLGVSRSGYYGWASRAESARSVEDRVVAAEIRTTHEASRGRYGSPRVHAALRAHGRRVGRKRVARLILAWGCRPGAGAGSAAPPTARTPSRWRRTCSGAISLPARRIGSGWLI